MQPTSNFLFGALFQTWFLPSPVSSIQSSALGRHVGTGLSLPKVVGTSAYIGPKEFRNFGPQYLKEQDILPIFNPSVFQNCPSNFQY